MWGVMKRKKGSKAKKVKRPVPFPLKFRNAALCHAALAHPSYCNENPSVKPYTDFELGRFPSEGKKRLLVLSPAFVADCLETLEELQQQGRATFLNAGGETFQQVPCPNDHPAFIDFLAKRVQQWLNRARA